jgi:ribosomal protein L11
MTGLQVRAATALPGCNIGNAKPAAEVQIMAFHNRYNARQFQVMYDSADARLRS